MSGFNLPPGVNSNMIPGNRPEDEENEAFWNELDAKFIANYGDNGKKWLTMLEDIDPEDMIFEYVEEARELAYMKGYQDGSAEAEMRFDPLMDQKEVEDGSR